MNRTSLFVLLIALNTFASDQVPGSKLIGIKSLSGHGGKVTYVPQHTFEVTALDETAVLETCSVGPCLAVAIYDPIERKAALGHFDAVTNVEPSLRAMLAEFPKTSIVRIAGGLERWSEELLEDLKTAAATNQRSVTSVSGPYPFSTDFKCVRLYLKDGRLEILQDPKLGRVPSARYDSRSDLQRLRHTMLYLPTESTGPNRPMPPPIPPSKD